jgi:hypothetical protein
VLVVLAIAAAACYRPVSPAIGDGAVSGDGSALGGDGGDDGGNTGSGTCAGVSTLLRVCSGDVTPGSGTLFAGQLDTAKCTGGAVVTTTNGQICELVGASVRVGSLTATGPNPLAIISTVSMNVSGTLDVSSYTGKPDGAGAGSATPCGTAEGDSAEDSGGGDGGSYGSVGGAGGLGDSGAFGGQAGATRPVSLAPGCAGGLGVGTGGAITSGGPAGGIVLLVSLGTLTIEAGASVLADGGGGGGGASATSTSGGGGGAGGVILLAAAGTIDATHGTIAAIGGGGGGGAANSADGSPGSESTGLAPATGGMGGVGGIGSGGGGGDGGFDTGTPALGGSTGMGVAGTGGGGGGGFGYVIVSAPTLMSAQNIHPSPSS